MLSVIKSVLVLENGIIPPNVNFEKANPKIPVDEWNLRFPVKSTPWPRPGLRRISVNSLGVGGTNGHAILDDTYSYLTSNGLQGNHNTNLNIPNVPEIENLVSQTLDPYSHKTNGTTNGDGLLHQNGDIVTHNGTNGINGFQAKSSSTFIPRIFTITSFDEDGVKRTAKTYAEFFQDHQLPPKVSEAEYLNDLAYTMSNRRSLFPWRSYALANSLEELENALSSGHGIPKAVRVRSQPKIAYVFTGQGAQWHAMGRELLVYPIFEKSLHDASEYMISLGAEWSLIDELMKDKSETNVDKPYLAHPSCAAIQIGLVDLLSSWDILPSRVVGHSSGEIAAAYCAGKLSRLAAWKTAYFRGFVCAKQSGSKGSMMAVGLSESALRPYIENVDAEIEGEVNPIST